jgi:hypothetical protein
MRVALNVRLICCAGALALLSGCASLAPGYVPPSEKKSRLDSIKPFEAGDVAANGAYVPSDAEKALACPKLYGSMRIIVTRLKDSTNRPRPSAVASTVQSARKAVTSTPGIDMTAEEQREKARLVAYNKLLVEKKCEPMNIEVELSGAPPAAPQPGKKKS